MTRMEATVIQKAFNLAESVVAGDWNLPKPMNVAINELQDAVHELASARGLKSLSDGCSEEFIKMRDAYYEEMEHALLLAAKRDGERKGVT